MSDDPRCCGSGTCIVDPEGRCWCGQIWDGSRMVAPAPPPPPSDRLPPRDEGPA